MNSIYGLINHMLYNERGRERARQSCKLGERSRKSGINKYSQEASFHGGSEDLWVFPAEAALWGGDCAKGLSLQLLPCLWNRGS